LSRFFRLLIAVVLTAVILWKVHPGDVLRSTANADWTWIGAAVALVLLDRTLMAYRWMVLLCALTPGSRPPFTSVLRIFFVSTFVGTFLPSVGGDLYRAYSLSKMQVNAAESAASVLMDRVLGVLSLLVVCVAALAAARHVVSSALVFPAVGVAALICIVAAFAVFSARAATFAQSLATRIPNGRLARGSVRLIDGLRRYAHHSAALANVLMMSVLVQVVRVLQAYCLGLAIGVDVPLPLYFVFIPVIVLIMQIPVAPSGIGTSQAAFLWLFGAAGVPAADAVALSILFVALGFVGNLPGALLYVAGGRPEPQRT